MEGIITKDCRNEADVHEMIHYYREGLKIKTLKKGDVVEIIERWQNFYGEYVRVKKNNEIFDIKPECVR